MFKRQDGPQCSLADRKSCVPQDWEYFKCRTQHQIRGPTGGRETTFHFFKEFEYLSGQNDGKGILRTIQYMLLCKVLQKFDKLIPIPSLFVLTCRLAVRSWDELVINKLAAKYVQLREVEAILWTHQN
jgi:hypothetical protein